MAASALCQRALRGRLVRHAAFARPQHAPIITSQWPGAQERYLGHLPSFYGGQPNGHGLVMVGSQLAPRLLALSVLIRYNACPRSHTPLGNAILGTTTLHL